MKFVTVLAAMFMSMGTFAETPVGTYTIDASHTRVSFEVPHMVISSVEGRFNKFDGSLTLDKELAKSKVEANIEVNSIDTADAKRDEHLKASDFFDAKKFPKMTFVSSEFAGSPTDLKIKGKMTLRGVTKDVVFDAKLSNEISNPWGKKVIALTGTTKVNRKDFGMSFGKMMDAGPVVGDDVTVSIKAELVKK